MAAITARELIKESYRSIEAISIDDTIDGTNKETMAFNTLNRILSLWSAKRLNIHQITPENFTLTVGAASRTIGSSGNFNTVRPMRILEAYIRDSSGNDYPVDPTMTREEYTALTDKDVSGRPTKLYYRPNYPLGVIYFDYAPSAAEVLYINSWKPLSQIALVTDTLGLPLEYEEHLKWEVAMAMASQFGTQLSQLSYKLAMEARDAIASLNAQPVPEVSFDNALIGRGANYNINVG